jgi:hemoglobin-like flavoprotein
MGSGSSANNPATQLQQSESNIVKLMFPLYYSPTNITAEEHKIASDGWNAILNDKTPEFLARKTDPKFGYSSCVIFFYDSFYTRLFNVHPMSKHLFKNGMRSQGKFLVKMITLALSEINDSSKFDKTLIKLAEIHNERGVKAIECKYAPFCCRELSAGLQFHQNLHILCIDGTVGEVLFWVLRKIIGDQYDSKVHQAWVKVYSRMLRIIVPNAVAMELATGSSFQQKRFGAGDSTMFDMSREGSAITQEADVGEMDHLKSEKIRKAAPTVSEKNRR